MKDTSGFVNSWQRLRLITLPLLAIVFSLLFATSARANSTTVTTSSVFPISLTVLVPCASGGVGASGVSESVALSGNLHDLFHVTFNFSGQGGFHLDVLDNPQGVEGVNLTTGENYQGTGATRFDANSIVGGTSVSTFVNNFLLIGQGPGNNFLVHEDLHVTVNPDGTVTSFHDHFSLTCQ